MTFTGMQPLKFRIKRTVYQSLHQNYPYAVWQLNPMTLFNIIKAVGRYFSPLIVEALAAVNIHWMKSDSFFY
jgi:hypothetical protein